MSKKIKLPKKRLKKRITRLCKLGRSSVSLDLKKRLVVLNGGITHETFTAFISVIYKMQDANELPIHVKIIRSKGGNAIASMMIHAVLRNSFAPVICTVEKYAESGAVHILLGGSERIMNRRARIKFHWVDMTEFICKSKKADEKTLKDLLKYVEIFNNKIYQMMRERTKLSINRIRKFHRDNKVFSADEALKCNIIDKLPPKKNRSIKNISKQ